VIGVFMERMLPSTLADDAQQDFLTWVHMGVAIVGLMWILNAIVGVHIIRHGASVDHEVGRMVGLGWNLKAAS